MSTPLAATTIAAAALLRPASKLESERATSSAASANANHVRESAEDKQKRKQIEAQNTRYPPGVYPDINTIRNAIPPHCFQPSLWISCGYLLRDMLLIGATAYVAIAFIPKIEDFYVRCAAWVAYGFIQGLFCTGLWILAHECGHGGFSLHTRINNIIGWAAHSFLMVPYFSWKFSHARHHRFTGHMEKDMAFVPRTQADHEDRWMVRLGLGAEVLEDTPIVAFVRLVIHQLFGWQAYLLFNVTAGPDSRQPDGKQWGMQSHFDPTSSVFRPSERIYIAISDLGLLIMGGFIYYGASVLGWSTMALLYLVPYLWVHHWLVAITYLHHTHPDVPHFDAENWTYVKGALATIDRDFGFIGKTLFHGIIDTHVVHHLFSKIPFYYAEEATESIKPMLGDLYRTEKGFMRSLWPAFTELKYVVPSTEVVGEMRWAKSKKTE
ncbi:related to bifunctional D12/D15 fatty acid desaturase [Cephalotrichum gorgonifer]|uniref:Related to bifunctional D12/D15 fatty acid desaturase n=1 Tax=Cephalotrichum gorgonifer TaxID=2041049 RepID=A0AAE8SUX6_9PEZI|nr:related to bifunctional D12/D15 fatty acid desaturase [Cephalotrichum gorgonifer]